jgi:hypothetical protein
LKKLYYFYRENKEKERRRDENCNFFTLLNRNAGDEP